MSQKEVEQTLIFWPTKHLLLERFVFKSLPSLVVSAHATVTKTPTRKRPAALYQCFVQGYVPAIESFLGGSTGAANAYCTTFVKHFEKLAEEEPVTFLNNRIEEDLVRPIKYVLRVWMRWVCDGPPRRAA